MFFTNNCKHIITTLFILLLVIFIIVDALSFNDAIQTTINNSLIENDSDGDIVLYRWLYFLGVSLLLVCICWFLYYRLGKNVFNIDTNEKLKMF